MNFFSNKRNTIIAVIALLIYTMLISYVTISIYKNHISNELEKTVANISEMYSSNSGETTAIFADNTQEYEDISEKPEITDVILNNTYSTENWEITFTSAEIVNSFEYNEKNKFSNEIITNTENSNSGEVYIVVEAIIKNIGNDIQTFDSSSNSFKVIWNEKYNYNMEVIENPFESDFISLKPLETTNVIIYTNVLENSITDSYQCHFVIDGQIFLIDNNN